MMGDARAGEDRSTLDEIGVRAVLTKPFGATELIKSLSAVLGDASGKLKTGRLVAG
jgi:DNA-binding response OmpR family regulator